MSNDTHLLISSDTPTGASSTAHDANINAVGFNLDFIASKNPNLAIAIMGLYNQAKQIHPDDPSQPDEDFDLALEQLRDLLK